METSSLPVDRVAGRTGLPAEVIAIVFVVIGVLVIVFPAIIAWLVGLLLIATGAWWLAVMLRERRAETAPPPSPPRSGMPPTS